MIMKKMSNKQSGFIFLGMIIILLIIYFFNHKEITNEKINTKSWLLYENTDLGVSFKYPKQIMGEDIVFFQVGNMLLITTNNSIIYTHKNEFTSTDPVLIKRQIWDMEQKYNIDFVEEGWQIWVSNVNSDTDLTNIIKKWFGELYNFGDGCKLGEKLEIPEKRNYYSIGIDAVRPNDDLLESSSCPVNWRVNFEYSSEYKRAAIWDMDQEDHFYFNDRCINNAGEHNCSADDLMKESFRFIRKAK